MGKKKKEKNTEMRIEIIRLFYVNKEKGWISGLARIIRKKKNPEIKIAGNISDPAEGDLYDVSGYYEDNIYGHQFQITKSESAMKDPIITDEAIRDAIDELLPDNRDWAYLLLTGFVKGIGPKMTYKIVKNLGNKLDLVLSGWDEDCLDFLNETTRYRFVDSVNEFRCYRKLCGFFKGFITPNRAIKIYDHYATEVEKNTESPCFTGLDKIKENPYVLIAEIDGIGFNSLDDIVRKLDLPNYEELRFPAAILEAMRQTNAAGHCYCTETELLSVLEQFLQVKVDQDRFETTLLQLIDKNLVVVVESKIYLKKIYSAETESASFINEHNHSMQTLSSLAVDRVLNSLHLPFELDPSQKRAVHVVNSNELSIITGGPGTGKSTIIKAIIQCWLKNNKEDTLRLLAPTGRASKRLAEATDHEASTIHRYMYHKAVDDYGQNDTLLYIIDEVSMVDVNLLYSFFKVVSKSGKCKIVLVGDKDQLPSIGPGRVLSDLQHKIPTAELTKQHRSEGDIAWNASMINNGCKFSDLVFGEKTQFVPCDKGEILSKCIETYKEEVKAHGIQNVCILTARRKEDKEDRQHTSMTINKLLHPDFIKEPEVKNKIQVGDRVMQRCNNYNLKVFNGDLGIVSNITPKSIIVKMDDGRIIEYTPAYQDELVMAYAMTIHKSQGSEFDVCIIPMNYSDYIMLQRNLLYTAVTRAKQKVILIGDKKAFAQAIRENKEINRHTRLKSLVD